MRATNDCDLVCDALLDPTVPRPPGMEAHLASCAACRRLRDAHLAARDLRRVPDRVPQTIEMEHVLLRVRRRRRTRIAVGAAAAALVLAVLSPGGRSERRQPEDVFALAEHVGGYSLREVATEDPALLAFAPMTDWLAPPPRRSLGLPSLGESPRSAAASGGVSP